MSTDERSKITYEPPVVVPLGGSTAGRGQQPSCSTGTGADQCSDFGNSAAGLCNEGNATVGGTCQAGTSPGNGTCVAGIGGA